MCQFGEGSNLKIKFFVIFDIFVARIVVYEARLGERAVFPRIVACLFGLGHGAPALHGLMEPSNI